MLMWAGWHGQLALEAGQRRSLRLVRLQKPQPQHPSQFSEKLQDFTGGGVNWMATGSGAGSLPFDRFPMKPRVVLMAFLCVLLGAGVWMLRMRSKAAAATETVEVETLVETHSSAPPERLPSGDASAWRDAVTVANARIHDLEQRLAELENRVAALEAKRTNRLVDIVDLQPAEAAEPEKRSWGPEQATGAPDTFQAADLTTAWAPRSQDGGPEWLQAGFQRAVTIAKVRVRETYNPGAIIRVTAIPEGGGEFTLWEGSEPHSVAPVEMEFTASVSVTARSVKVYLDTSLVPGWNEIDAVELIGQDGSRQWATSATASSTFASAVTSNAPGGARGF
jgi:hypothetical protein